MTITRRELLALGGSGAAGVAVGTRALVGSAGAAPSVGGIHIHVTAKIVKPAVPPFAGYPHTFIATLWGPDDALSGTGCGFTDGSVTQRLVGGMYVNCVFGLWGKVEEDVLRGEGIMAYSADPDERRAQPFPFEANLSTGFCRFTDANMGMGSEVVAEGTGAVLRI